MAIQYIMGGFKLGGKVVERTTKFRIGIKGCNTAPYEVSISVKHVCCRQTLHLKLNYI